VTRARAKEYRSLAEECLAAMRTVSTEEARAVLIERAQYWLRLAKEQDDESTAGESQSAAQQQQQIQPKDDDKKE
jgi:hypothetical protein